MVASKLWSLRTSRGPAADPPGSPSPSDYCRVVASASRDVFARPRRRSRPDPRPSSLVGRPLRASSSKIRSTARGNRTTAPVTGNTGSGNHLLDRADALGKARPVSTARRCSRTAVVTEVEYGFTGVTLRPRGHLPATSSRRFRRTTRRMPLRVGMQPWWARPVTQPPAGCPAASASVAVTQLARHPARRRDLASGRRRRSSPTRSSGSAGLAGRATHEDDESWRRGASKITGWPFHAARSPVPHRHPAPPAGRIQAPSRAL